MCRAKRILVKTLVIEAEDSRHALIEWKKTFLIIFVGLFLNRYSDKKYIAWLYIFGQRIYGDDLACSDSRAPVLGHLFKLLSFILFHTSCN